MSLTLEHKAAVHELLSKASYAYDARDLEMLAACFAPDASLTMRIAQGELVGPFDGRAAIMELMRGAMAEQTDVRRHVVSNTFFDEGDSPPVAVSFLTLIATESEETRLLTTGVYRDSIAQDETGNWQIVARHIELDNAY